MRIELIACPSRVVQLASDPRSLLGDREALLARDALPLLRGPLPCQAAAIADDPAARPQERGDRVVARLGFEASPGHGEERREGGDADDQDQEGVLSPVALGERGEDDRRSGRGQHCVVERDERHRGTEDRHQRRSRRPVTRQQRERGEQADGHADHVGSARLAGLRAQRLGGHLHDRESEHRSRERSVERELARARRGPDHRHEAEPSGAPPARTPPTAGGVSSRGRRRRIRRADVSRGPRPT